MFLIQDEKDKQAEILVIREQKQIHADLLVVARAAEHVVPHHADFEQDVFSQ